MQTKFFLVCGYCTVKHRNYITSKTKNEKEKKIILHKYCKFCRKTQIHQEEIVKKEKK